METLTLDEAPTRVWRKGQGAPLIFLHGIEQHMGAARFLERLAEERRVIAPELPGFGETGGAEGLQEISDLVLKLRAVLGALVEDGPAVLVGHSLGGMVAAELAAYCPDLVSHLVLVNSYGFWLDEHPMPDYFVMQEKALEEALWSTRDSARIHELRGSFLAETDRNLGDNRTAATRFIFLVAADIDRRESERSGEQSPACAARPRPLPDKFPARDSEAEPAPTAQREVDRVARVVVGDRVTTVSNTSSGHTRLPGYARGSVGEVVRVHNAWVFPDTNAHTGNEAPQYLYTVRFDGEALYGKDCESGLFVNLDLFEPYLQETNDVT